MLFDELSKIKRSSIMTSIMLVAVGIVMIICPPQYVESLVAVLGYGMVILAGVMMLDFINAKKSLINCIKFGGALILLLLGISVLVFTEIVQLIGIVFGYLVCIPFGLVNLQPIADAAWIGLPFKSEDTVLSVFRNPDSALVWGAIFTIMPIALATMVEHIDDRDQLPRESGPAPHPDG